MHSRMCKMVSVMMAVLVPLSLMAAEPGALATPSGSVTLNGNTLSRESAVFAGDRIGTAKDGSVALTLTGSSVQVGPKSAVVFTPNQLTVSSGGIKVQTTTGMSGQIRNLDLRPDANAKSVYTVAERDGKILIAALQGSLKINDGHRAMTLAADHAVAIPVQDNTTENQKPCKKNDKKCAAGAGAAGAGAGAAAGGAAAAGATVSTAVAVGIAAAAAAVSAGVSYGVASVTQQTSTSPH